MDSKKAKETFRGEAILSEVPNFVRWWLEKPTNYDDLRPHELERLIHLVSRSDGATFWKWLKTEKLKKHLRPLSRRNTIEFLRLCIRPAWNYTDVRSHLRAKVESLEFLAQTLASLEVEITSKWRKSFSRPTSAFTIKKILTVIGDMKLIESSEFNEIKYLTEREHLVAIENHVTALKKYLNQTARYKSLKTIVKKAETGLSSCKMKFSPKLQINISISGRDTHERDCEIKESAFSPQTTGDALGLNNFLISIYYLIELIKVKTGRDRNNVRTGFNDVKTTPKEAQYHRCNELIWGFDNYFGKVHAPSILFILSVEFGDPLGRNRIDDSIKAFYKAKANEAEKTQRSATKHQKNP